MTLDSGTTLRVAVVDKADAKVRARVSVKDENGHEVSGMLTMSEIMNALGRGFESGEQEIGPLPPGTYEVSAVLDDGTEYETVFAGFHNVKPTRSKYKEITFSGKWPVSSRATQIVPTALPSRRILSAFS